ncbi:putative diguanylate cyclase YegE [mine drainage metagenome]|uniref:Putative diguanylate cyclase YegE n=1 Tax=mine drainage metagenome TaxID=410659 RepID=A0A1J5RL28_9ZZZZ
MLQATLPEVFVSISLTEPVVVLKVSDCIDQLLGYQPVDFLSGNISFRQLIHTGDQDIAESLFSSEFSQISGDFNIRLRQGNGHIRCVKGYFTKKLASTGVVLDLSLQDAKSLSQLTPHMMPNFKAMMDNTNDYIYFKDRNHVFTGASQTLVSLTNPSEHWTDLLGQTDYDVFPEEYADIYYELEKQVFAGIPIAHEIQETLDNAGKKGWVDNRKYPIQNESGEIIGLFGIARDITDSHLKQQKIEQLVAEQSAILDNKLVGMVTAKARNITWANSAVETLLGYKKGALVGAPTRQLYVSQDEYEAVGAAYANIKLEGVIRRQCEFLRHDGQSIWVDMHGMVLSEADGISLWIMVDVTARKLAEDALLKSEAKFRALYDSNGEAAMLLDEHGFFDCNKAALKLFGIKTIEEFCLNSPADLSPLQQPCGTNSEVLAKQKIVEAMEIGNLRFEWTHKRIDTDETFPAEVLLSVIELDGRAVIMAAVRDTTESKRSELLLRASEQQLSFVLEGSNLGFWDWDIQSGHVQRNHIWAEMLGYTFEEVQLTTQQWTDFLHPDDVQNAWKSIQEHLEGKTSVHESTYRMRTKSGDYKWVLDRARVVQRDVNGRPTRMAGTHADVTEQKLAENDLRIAAAAFETQDGMFVTDVDGTILRVNQAYTAITGYTAADAVGKNPRILKSGRHDSEFYASMWQSLASTGLWSGEVWNKRKGGEVYPEYQTITAVKSTDGITTHYVASFADITERIRMQEELKNRAEKDFLTGLTNRRHFIELAEAELIRAQRYSSPLSMLMMDIDFFKCINDTYGHKAGDLVLQKLAVVCKEVLREIDVIGRLGGEEFSVLLPETGVLRAVEVAGRLRQALESARVVVDEVNHEVTKPLCFTVSIGVAAMSSVDATVDSMLLQADVALYKAKNSGRNKVVANV